MRRNRINSKKWSPWILFLVLFLFPALAFPATLYLPLIQKEYDTDQFPIAINDQYSVDEGGTLNGSPGVLANDQEPQGCPLSAVLVTDVGWGTLTL